MTQSSSIRYGALGAVAVIFFFTLVYVANKSLFLHPAVQWGSLVIYLIFMYQAAREENVLLGANRDFRAMVRTPFLVFVLINLGYWLFFYGLHLYDKSLVVMELDASILALKSQLEAGTGDPATANDLRQQINQLEGLRNNPAQPLGPVLAQMAQGALGGFLLAAVVTTFIRKN